jgi:sulfoquinovose isomerase
MLSRRHREGAAAAMTRTGYGERAEERTTIVRADHAMPSEAVPGNVSWLAVPSHRDWLQAHAASLLAFGRRTPVAGGGAAWLDDTGAPLPDRPIYTWLTARTVHVYALGHLLGIPGSRPIAETALAGLTGLLHDDDHGGWYPSVSPDGKPAPGKSCYDHVFVVLAGSSAVCAGLPGGADLLSDALGVFERRFWDERAGMCVDTWDTAFAELDPYRGMNANMHAVEALLAASDVTGEVVWRQRAERIAGFLVKTAERHRWRIPEHFDDQWRPELELNVDQPNDQFKPYGATVGHGLEWSRLLLHLEAAEGHSSGHQRWAAASQALFDRAVADGWARDGAPGFVYTTRWDGSPVVRDRMHWVAAEAIGAAAALSHRTGDDRYAELYATWWDYVAQYHLDPVHGSWLHQLNPQNEPDGTVWEGKADLYHAFQATLIPRLPLAPTLATALAARLLE